jgi:hypothetical protein
MNARRVMRLELYRRGTLRANSQGRNEEGGGGGPHLSRLLLLFHIYSRGPPRGTAGRGRIYNTTHNVTVVGECRARIVERHF